jgi:hypothetical protein
MGGTYDIFEKLPKTSSSRHEYIVYDSTRGCEVSL